MVDSSNLPYTLIIKLLHNPDKQLYKKVIALMYI